MAAAMSNELWYAILAMDAYDRGYGAKLPGLSDAGGTRLGNATIIGAAGDAAAQADGFYAIAYELDGRKIIAFRGTDNPDIFSQGNDIWNGWVAGAGVMSTQSEDAIQFYQKITGTSVFEKNANVVTTGHSLGGGLAGYVAALSNGEAYVYDHMPYAAAAITKVVSVNCDQNLGSLTFLGFLSGANGSPNTLMPNADRVKAISVDYEVLAAVRITAATLGSAVEAGIATGLLATNGYLLISLPGGAAAGVQAALIAGQGSGHKLDPYVGLFSGIGTVERHDQTLLAMLQYAKDNNFTDWTTIAAPLLTSWFSVDTGKPLGLTTNQMMREVVYSAIDTGVTPYGTVAIQSLFDDANELGRLYALPNQSGNWSDATVKSALSAIVSEYAGDLAMNKAVDPKLAGGVFSYDTGNHMLALDLRPSTWDLGATLSDSIVQKQALIAKLTGGFLSIGETNKIALILSAAQKADAVIATDIRLKPTEYALILADGKSDQVTGTAGNDYIYPYDSGNDVIDGARGINTVVYGGKVSDYKIVKTATGVTITELVSGTNQTDTLINIQQIKFADQTITPGIRSADPKRAALLSVDAVAASDSANPTTASGAVVEKGVTLILDLDSVHAYEIAALYQACFERLPDVDGMRFWETVIQMWGDDQTALRKLADELVGSAEYRARHAGLSDEEFVSGLYREAFGRDPDLAGWESSLRALNSGASRTDLLMAFAQSQEMVQLIGQQENLDTGFWTIS